jgi:hypothetical protein
MKPVAQRVCGPELDGHAVLVEGIVHVCISYVRTLQEKTYSGIGGRYLVDC